MFESDISIRRYCSLLISHIANETESTILSNDFENIEFFVSTLREAVHPVHLQSAYSVYTTGDLLNGLAGLANASDSIGIHIVQLGVLAVLVEILSASKSLDEDVASTIKLVWILTFNEKCKVQMGNMPDLLLGKILCPNIFMGK